MDIVYNCIIVLCLSLLNFSCTDPAANEAQVAYKSYVHELCDGFYKEATLRGVQLRKQKIDIQFRELPKTAVAKCILRSDPVRIIIDPIKWKRQDIEQQRALVFHELGHGVLGRKHLNKKLPRGECVSLMDGKEGPFECTNNVYSPLWWSYYLDELFDAQTSIPAWYENEYTFKLSYCETISMIDSKKRNRDDKRMHLINLKDFKLKDSTYYSITTPSLSTTSIRVGGFHYNYNPPKSLLILAKQTSPYLLDPYYYRAFIKPATVSNHYGLAVHKGFLYFFFNNKLIHQMEALLGNESEGLAVYAYSTEPLEFVIKHIQE